MTKVNEKQKHSVNTNPVIDGYTVLPAVYSCENTKPKVKKATITEYDDCAKLEIVYYYKLTGLAGIHESVHRNLREAKRWYGREVQQQKYFEKPIWFLNGR